MGAPVITFYTSSSVTNGSLTTQCATGSWGLMSTVYDYGTIDTGSSGSTVYFWIVNNAAGAASISDVILSSSAQAQADGTCLGFGHHESGSASHASESSYSWSLQSGSLTGSVFVSSSYFYMSNAGFTGSVATSGSLTRPYIYVYSGSSGNRLFVPANFILSGSQNGGASGSAWLIASYLNVLNATPQGTKTGSFCLKYKYT